MCVSGCVRAVFVWRVWRSEAGRLCCVHDKRWSAAKQAAGGGAAGLLYKARPAPSTSPAPAAFGLSPSLSERFDGSQSKTIGGRYLAASCCCLFVLRGWNERRWGGEGVGREEVGGGERGGGAGAAFCFRTVEEGSVLTSAEAPAQKKTYIHKMAAYTTHTHRTTTRLHTEQQQQARGTSSKHSDGASLPLHHEQTALEWTHASRSFRSLHFFAFFFFLSFLPPVYGWWWCWERGRGEGGEGEEGGQRPPARRCAPLHAAPKVEQAAAETMGGEAGARTLLKIVLVVIAVALAALHKGAAAGGVLLRPLAREDAGRQVFGLRFVDAHRRRVGALAPGAARLGSPAGLLVLEVGAALLVVVLLLLACCLRLGFRWRVGMGEREVHTCVGREGSIKVAETAAALSSSL